MREALLTFIAEFANWDNSIDKSFFETARLLTQAAHESLGGVPGTRPLVVDPFAGGGAIPLEALRIGADAFASDLNPVAVLLNKVVLEYIPKHGARLAEEVRCWGAWVKEQAEAELGRFLSQGRRRRGADRVYLGADDPLRGAGLRGRGAARALAVVVEEARAERRHAARAAQGQERRRGGDRREPEGSGGQPGHGAPRLGDLSVLRVHDAGGLGAPATQGAPGRCSRCEASVRGDDPCRASRGVSTGCRRSEDLDGGAGGGRGTRRSAQAAHEDTPSLVPQ